MNKNKCNPPRGKICIYCWNSFIFLNLWPDSKPASQRCVAANQQPIQQSTICQMWHRRLADGLGSKLLLTFQDQTHHHAVKSDMWWSSRVKLVRQKVKKTKKNHTQRSLRDAAQEWAPFAATHLSKLGLELGNLSLVYHLSVWHDGH